MDHIYLVFKFVSPYERLVLFTLLLIISLTITFQSLSNQPKQHFSTVITESRGPVRVHIERVGPNLEIFKRSCR